MDQNKKLLKLRDIRGGDLIFYSEDYKLEIKKYEFLSSWIASLVNYLIFNEGDPIYILNTNVLSNVLLDLDSINEKNRPPNYNAKISLGFDDSDNHFGYNQVFLSKSKVISIENDNDISEYLIDCSIESFQKYFDTFNVEYKDFEVKKLKLKSNGWFLQTKKELENKKKTKSIIFEKRYGKVYDQYRLKVINKLTDEINYVEIGYKKNYANIFLEKSLDEYVDDYIKNKEPRDPEPAYLFENLKWQKNDVFTFTWGEEELYTLDTDTFELEVKTLIRVVKEIVYPKQPTSILPKVLVTDVTIKEESKQVNEIYLSSDVIILEIQKQFLPTAKHIETFFKNKKIEIEFCDYWGDKLSSTEIIDNLHGVNIVRKNEKAGVEMQIEESKDSTELQLKNFNSSDSLFDIIVYEFLDSLNFIQIQCGTYIYTKEQWITAKNSSEFKSIYKQSTLET